jgi:hypothetical protein
LMSIVEAQRFIRFFQQNLFLLVSLW